MRTPKLCEICATLRPLDEHLHELAMACEYLGNVVPYSNTSPDRLVRSTAISDWLKLASQLQAVEVNAWKFTTDDALYCGTAASRVDSDSKHFSAYSTSLTRFIFVTSALEEAYRFVNRYYKPWADAQNIPQKDRSKTSSVRAAVLIDTFPRETWPLHFGHLVRNCKKFFDYYAQEHKGEVSGMQFIAVEQPSYALHLVRNLRNHVAHGVFPIISNPEYEVWENGQGHLLNLLDRFCRMSAVYIQMLVWKYNAGFESYDYRQIERATSPEFEYFIKNCTVDHIKNLHVRGKFSLTSVFDYQERQWEESDESS